MRLRSQKVESNSLVPDFACRCSGRGFSELLEGVNIISSNQKYTGLSTTIRTNSRQLIFFKLRNYKEVESVLDELAGVLISKKAMSDMMKSLHQAKQILLQIYNIATDEPFSFLFVNLM